MLNKKLNCIPSLPDHRDFKYARIETHTVIHKLPAMASTRAYQSPVVDQLNIGSCTGNAIMGAFEFLQLQDIRNNVPEGRDPEEFIQGQFCPGSRLFVYWNERNMEGTANSDAGASIRDGCDVVTGLGACPEGQWPYDQDNVLKMPNPDCFATASAHKITAYYALDNLYDMKRCIQNGFPFVAGISVYDSFMSEQVAETGVVPMPALSENLQGGHAVLVVGYDDHTLRFTVKNSWGTAWGDQGYFTIPYEYLLSPDLAMDFYTLRHQPVSVALPLAESVEVAS